MGGGERLGRNARGWGKERLIYLNEERESGSDIDGMGEVREGRIYMPFGWLLRMFYLVVSHCL